MDEMGSNLGVTRLYGRAAPGQRVVDEVPGERGKNVSTIGAIALDGIRTGLSVTWPMDGETILFFVEEMLVPTLQRGEIVVLDNCSFINKKRSKRRLKRLGRGFFSCPRIRLTSIRLKTAGQK